MVNNQFFMYKTGKQTGVDMSNLESHRFSDSDISFDWSSESELTLNISTGCNFISFSRDDVLAMSKSFNITAEELECNE